MQWILWIALILFGLRAGANVVGVSNQNFNPVNDGLDFVTVHSSKTLRPGLLNVGLFLNYAVNTLPNYEDSAAQSRTGFQDSLLSSDVNFGLGVARRWEVGMSFPSVLAQKIDSDLNTFGGEYAQTGLTETRLMTKVRLAGDSDSGLASVFSVNFNHVRNDPFLGRNPGPTYNFELAADTLISKRVAFAVNAGYRMRNAGAPVEDVPITPFKNSYIASTAMSYLFSQWDTKIIAEVFGSWPDGKQQHISGRQASTAEALLGIKTDLTRALALHAGGGTELIHGTASPDWRVYTGINWVVGPLFNRPKPVIVRVARPQHIQKVLERAAVNISDKNSNPFLGPPQLKEDFVMSDILFEFDSVDVNPEFRDLLQRLAEYLQRPPVFKSLVIEGHSDTIGDSKYNLELSRRRAENVHAFLVNLGLPAARIKSVGYGAAKPIASNGNFQGRALNRRVEFKVLRQ